jgi:hypothetical protein
MSFREARSLYQEWGIQSHTDHFRSPSRVNLVELIDKNDTIQYHIGIQCSTTRKPTMPQGKHSSIRVALAVPPKLHEQLQIWADFEGRPVASLCLALVEQGLRQAQRDGYAPSISNPDLLKGESRFAPTGTVKRYEGGKLVEEKPASDISEDEKDVLMKSLMKFYMERS